MQSQTTNVWCWVWLASGGLVLLTWIGSTYAIPWRILLQTILLAALALTIALPLGLWFAQRWIFGGRWERCLIVPVVSLALVPLCLQVAAWESVLGRLRNALVDPEQPWAFVTANWGAAAWIHGVSGGSWLAIIFVVGFWSRGWVLEQQALLDATSRQVFWRVTVARLRPVLFAAALWIFVLVARDIAVTDIYQIGTYAQQVYLGYALDRLPWPTKLPEDQSVMQYLGFLRQAVFVGWLAASAAFAIRLIADDAGEEPVRPAYEPPTARRQWPNWVTTILFGLVFAIPGTGLLIRAGTTTVLVDDQVLRHFSPTHLGAAFAKGISDYRWPMVWTLVIAASAAATTTLLAGILAWLAIRRNAIAVLVLFPLVAASMTIPYPLVGILVDSTFSSIPLEAFRELWDRSILGPVIACTSIAFGPVALLLYFAMRQSAKTMVDSMLTEQVGPLRLFFQVGFSANRFAFCAALGIAFLITAGDVAASFQVLPPGIDTVARAILGQLHSGVDDLTAAISLTLLVGANLMATGIGVGLARFANPRKRTIEIAR